ncbi:MAG TPA: ABC transporter permease [Bacteroidales bacterium]|jgi:ABC-2 type transport system permease protein|nr:ABC transporter permease [Bacteroidales bacterium]OQB61214.1 MAG: ABC-2 family transporter protein [Bacteroidetes bacterium ADurb.Bin145]HOU02252.1 ABC transporter permease [Bacteroidales bacterium]HQG62249.1 ABC transporter permease [Bacteroidales bacterium]HQK68588.1 ABC transporter permease [Bacteroidales bacterium]
MSKISVIIKREYITRVRKKSFIIMTILAPILMAAIIILPTVFMMSDKDKDFKKIAVIEDGSDLFRNVIPNTKDAEYVYLENADINELKKNFEAKGYYGILYISPELVNIPNAIQLISKQTPPIGLIDHISGSLEKEIERQKLLAYNIQNLDDILKNINTQVSVQTIKIDDTGKVKETSTGIAMAMAYIGGFLMYMLVFLFGSQVMRGVIEEKTSRVVEVIVSSVKPVQLMMGKIIGIALVGLTQFMIWVILTLGVVTFVRSTVLKKTDITEIPQTIPQSIMTENQLPGATAEASAAEINPQLAEFSKIFESAMNQEWLLIILAFIFYFITGYLLYASVFAAIGSAVDNETETQQFMMPVTIPIILGLMVAVGTMQNPESSIAFWCSIIPLTSPIVMIARIPFGVPLWQLLLSMGLMIITFLAFVWMAAKVYRTGILMYGKKTSWKEIWKWLKYSA